MDYILQAGATNRTIHVFIQDPDTGLGDTGLVYNSAGAACWYVRPGAAETQITLATQTVAGGHTDGGFVQIDATNNPGLYRLDLPDAVVASGVPFVTVQIQFTGSYAKPVTIVLTPPTTIIGIDTATANTIADHIWRRSNASIEASSGPDALDGQSPYGAVARLSNGIRPGAGNTIEILEADRTTVLDTHDITRDAGADPITGDIAQ